MRCKRYRSRSSRQGAVWNRLRALFLSRMIVSIINLSLEEPAVPNSGKGSRAVPKRVFWERALSSGMARKINHNQVQYERVVSLVSTKKFTSKSIDIGSPLLKHHL